VTVRIKLSAAAQGDLSRLPAFLSPKSAKAGAKARERLVSAIESLHEFPGRGRPSGRSGLREVFVRFGRDGYVIRYHSSDAEVFITRIFHTRERR
jgi:plasmid stabilization system protein ParE